MLLNFIRGWGFKKPEEPKVFPPVIDTSTFIQNKVIEPIESDLKVVDYKLHDYKVYWETVIDQEADYFVAEIRFIGHGVHDKIREVHTAIGRSFEHVQQLANKLIREKMESFKV